MSHLTPEIVKGLQLQNILIIKYNVTLVTSILMNFHQPFSPCETLLVYREGERERGREGERERGREGEYV
jgi:hypothetical protein